MQISIGTRILSKKIGFCVVFGLKSFINNIQYKKLSFVVETYWMYISERNCPDLKKKVRELFQLLLVLYKLFVTIAVTWGLEAQVLMHRNDLKGEKFNFFDTKITWVNILRGWESMNNITETFCSSSSQQWMGAFGTNFVARALKINRMSQICNKHMEK